MVRYLDRYFDPELQVDTNVRIEAITRLEAERLHGLITMVVYAGSISRRLGADATREELARDKRVARRIEHALRQSLRGWDREVIVNVGPPTAEQRSQAAVMDWKQWVDEHCLWLDNHCAYLATYAKKSSQELWGRAAIARLQRESEWLRYALR
jgi:hypothetical protein